MLQLAYITYYIDRFPTKLIVSYCSSQLGQSFINMGHVSRKLIIIALSSKRAYVLTSRTIRNKINKIPSNIFLDGH